MTKKKRARPTVDDLLARQWCYYCERDFDDLNILVSHQKAKHYRCLTCNRRLNTAGGLSVHMNQVHKLQLTEIENALPHRTDCNIEIFGMHGIPEEVLATHKQRVTEAFFKAEAEWRAASGHPVQGNNGDGDGTATSEPKAKKLKIETVEEIQKRLAEHKAKRQAEKLAKANGVPSPADDAPGDTPMTETHAVETQMPISGPNAWENPPQASTDLGTGIGQHGWPSGRPPTEYDRGFSGSPAAGPTTYAFQPSGYYPDGRPMEPQMPRYGPPGSYNPYGPPTSYNPYGAPVSYDQHGAPSSNGHGQHMQPPQWPQPGNDSTVDQHKPLPTPKTMAPASGKVSGLPRVPGLPPKPAVSLPNLSKQEMEDVHRGRQTISLGVKHSAERDSFDSRTHSVVTEPEAAQAQAKSWRETLDDDIDALIASVTQEQRISGPQAINAPPQTKMGMETPSAHLSNPHNRRRSSASAHESSDIVSHSRAPAKNAQTVDGLGNNSRKQSKKRRVQLMVDERVMPEQVYGSKPEYHFSRTEPTKTTLGQVGATVTGAMDETIRDPQDIHTGG